MNTKIYAIPVILTSASEFYISRTTRPSLADATFGSRHVNVIHNAIFLSSTPVAWLGSSANLQSVKSMLNAADILHYDELYVSTWLNSSQSVDQPIVRVSELPAFSDNENAAFLLTKRKLYLICDDVKEYISLDSFCEKDVDPLVCLTYAGVIEEGLPECVGRWRFKSIHSDINCPPGYTEIKIEDNNYG